ncbi:hypothetical protein L7F22_012794 [Adiantum nelumboides]|nr:hypothetical protein [Adiantum nelumboides]
MPTASTISSTMPMRCSSARPSSAFLGPPHRRRRLVAPLCTAQEQARDELCRAVRCRAQLPLGRRGRRGCALGHQPGAPRSLPHRLCRHDEVPYGGTDGAEDIYKFVKDQGRFLPTNRTPGVSTSELLARIVEQYREHAYDGKLVKIGHAELAFK